MGKGIRAGGGLETRPRPQAAVKLITLLKKYHLNAVAVRNATSEMEPAIIASGLSIDHVIETRRNTMNLIQTPFSASPNADYETMIIDTPIRAGQRIYARGR